MSKPLRVVLDTNVVISAFAFRAGRLAWLREALGALAIPIVSSETLAELVRTLGYPKLKLDAEQQKTILTFYMESAEAHALPRTRAKLPACRDPEDQKFLRLAYAAKADALVTGNADLLAAAAHSRIPIIEPGALKVRLGVT